MEQILIFLITGAVAGILAGLFGVGGGLIMVPALAFVLPGLDVPKSVYMQVAIGTSLAVIAVTSISSTLAHHRRSGVEWRVFARFAPGLAVGAVLGAFVADMLSGPTLKRIVGIGACLVSVQMAIKSFAHAGTEPAHGTRPHAGELAGVGGVIGLLSAVVGIGGGSLTVPYLSWRGLPVQRAVGTAAACGVPIAWAGAAGFVVSGLDASGIPAPHLGYISLAAFLGIAVASVSCAPLGAHLAHRLSPRVLKQLFALLLAGVGLRMLLA
ncbi:MAG: sulfite exporter TauE/SafE family protein [Nevskiales bacterium]|nr:sulfite exporter TauE/SafE family protein [Nevskiales bacterium]